MAGFAIVVDPDPSDRSGEQNFQALVDLTARYKRLDLPAVRADGSFCSAAKLDAESSLHPGVIHDFQTGSWLIAAGTVVALAGNNDPQVLLQDLLGEFLKRGGKALEHFDGHFAMAIYDAQIEQLSIISDPMGNFSIFFGRRGSQILISTSALAIARLVESEPDILCMESFLRSGMVYGDRTFWNDVKRVRPATIHTFRHENLDVSEYWAPGYDEKISQLSLNDAIEHADDMLSRLISQTLSREGKVWTDLTGGFDSRVATLYVANAGIPFVAYSVGPEGHPDVQIPRQICQKLGWEYQHMQLPENWEQAQFNWLETALWKGDARLSVASLAGVLYGQQLRSSVSKTNVTGLGLDEWREVTYLTALLFNWGKTYDYDRLLNAGILAPVPLSAMQQNRDGQVREEWKAYLSAEAANYSQFPNYVKSHAMFIRYRYPAHGGAFLSAASGILRAISPFCFKEPVDFAFSLPLKWRLFYHHQFIRSLLERKNPALANIETAKGGPAIPMRINNLHQFWPLWSSLIDQNAGRLSRKVLKKSIHLRKEPQVIGYPLPAWRTALARQSQADGWLTHSKMYSAGLYQAEGLQTVAAQVEVGQSGSYSFLDRVLTIEMAMRATGTCIK